MGTPKSDGEHGVVSHVDKRKVAAHLQGIIAPVRISATIGVVRLVISQFAIVVASCSCRDRITKNEPTQQNSSAYQTHALMRALRRKAHLAKLRFKIRTTQCPGADPPNSGRNTFTDPIDALAARGGGAGSDTPTPGLVVENDAVMAITRGKA